jgi:hypothetical protein
LKSQRKNGVCAVVSGKTRGGAAKWGKIRRARGGSAARKKPPKNFAGHPFFHFSLFPLFFLFTYIYQYLIKTITYTFAAPVSVFQI